MISESQFARRLAEAVEFEHKIGAITFRLRLPTRSQLRSTVLRHDGLSDTASRVAAMAECALQALIGADGITTKDLGLPGDPEPLPNSATVARAYVADNLDALDELSDVLHERMNARQRALEDDLKN